MKKTIILMVGLIVTQWNAFGFSKNMQQQPLCFEENKGQINDQHSALRPDIQYRLSTPGMSVFIGDGQLHYQFYKQVADNDSYDEKLKAVSAKRHIPLPGTFVTYRMDVTLVGANINAQTIATGQGADVANYYTGATGKNGATRVHNYQRITYQNIYPGIDWVLYIKNNKLEYDFVVHPGANPQDIQLSYGGASRLDIPGAGNLIAQTPLGAITEEKPYAYQQEDKQAVNTRFQLQGNTLSFATDAYKGTLVIDPGVDWATYYGGYASAVACDSKGYVYMVGGAYSTNDIATSGSYQDTLLGLEDAFLVKFDSLGHRIWATYYGGDSGYSNSFPLRLNGGTDVAIDEANGFVYMSGGTNSAKNIATPGSYQDTLSAPNDTLAHIGMDAFLVQFDTSGLRNWGTYLGGDSTDEGWFYGVPIAIDPVNNNIDIGITVVNSGMATAGAYQSEYAGGVDYFYGGDALITQFNSAGIRQWATYYGGTNDDALASITIDPAGNVYLAGSTQSTDGIASSNGFLTTLTLNNGGIPPFSVSADAFLARLNSTGSLREWGTYYGSGMEEGSGIACDRFGHIYMTGLTGTIESPTSNVNVISTPGAYQTLLAGGASLQGWDGFLVQFDSAGVRHWGTYYGGIGPTTGESIVCDYSGNVYLAGSTSTPSYPSPYMIATPGSHQDTLGGTHLYNDAYIAEFDTTGSRLWATYYGGEGEESVASRALAHDNNYALYLAGTTTSDTGIATPGSFQDTLGNGDAFLARFVPVDVAVTSMTLPTTDSVCRGAVPFSVAFQNKGQKAFDSIQVTTIYTNNITGLSDTLNAVTTQWLYINSSITLSIGNLNLDSLATYTVQTYIHHIADDSSYTDDTLHATLVTVINPFIGGITVSNTSPGVYTFSADSAVYIAGYHWIFGDGNTGNTDTVTHTYTSNGSYTVTLVGSNSCGSDTVITTINVTNLGIASITETGNISIYPNPAQQTLNIRIPVKLGATEMSVINSVGMKIYTTKADAQAPTNILDIHELPNGYYILKVSTNKGYYNLPFEVLK